MAIYNLILLLVLQAEPLTVQIHKLLRAGDAYNAGLVMESFGDARTIASNYIEVSNYLYWTAGDLPAFMIFSQQGIDTSLANANQVRSTNPQLAAALQASAATLAYNLASYSWPGWAEPGVTIGPAELAKGFAAAELSVQLRTELKAPPQEMSDAHWALGAQELARGRHPQAIAAFERAAQAASDGGIRSSALMARGYAAITKVAAKTDAAQGEQELKEAKDALLQIQDGRPLAEQLDVAYKVFVKP